MLHVYRPPLLCHRGFHSRCDLHLYPDSCSARYEEPLFGHSVVTSRHACMGGVRGRALTDDSAAKLGDAVSIPERDICDPFVHVLIQGWLRSPSSFGVPRLGCTSTTGVTVSTCCFE